jgi:hypothetical protein
MRIFDIMKTRVNLTIEDSILQDTKLYAEKQGTSVSEIVESYLKNITKPIKRKTIIDLVQELEKPNIDAQTDLKDLYYRERSEKYGF